MEQVVRVTRRGQTTIPIELRRRYRIKEGTRLVVEARDDEIVMRPLVSLEDLTGSLAEKSGYKKAVAILDEEEHAEE